MKPDYETIECKSSGEWRVWLDKHHSDTTGVWLRVYKKDSGIASVTIVEALDGALCYGWIDGQRNSYDELSYLQKYTPRRTRSLWSKRNIEYIERLTKAGLMMPAGITQVENAKADGRWAAAYDKASDMKLPPEFLDELAKHPKAEKFFKTLNKTNTFAIGWRLQTVKTEAGRKSRTDKIIAMLEAGEKLH